VGVSRASGEGEEGSAVGKGIRVGAQNNTVKKKKERENVAEKKGEVESLL